MPSIDAQRIEPLFTLYEGQFTQHASQRVKQIAFYNPSYIEILTNSGQQLALNTTNLPAFVSQEQFKCYLSNAYCILTQDAAIYSLTTRIRGNGGGNDHSKPVPTQTATKVQQTTNTATDRLQAFEKMYGPQALNILNTYRQQGWKPPIYSGPTGRVDLICSNLSADLIGVYLLHAAIAKVDMPSIKILLDAEVNVNKAVRYIYQNNSPYLSALAATFIHLDYGHENSIPTEQRIEMAKLLMERGADPDLDQQHSDAQHHYLIDMAASKKGWDLVELFLEQEKVKNFTPSLVIAWLSVQSSLLSEKSALSIVALILKKIKTFPTLHEVAQAGKALEIAFTKTLVSKEYQEQWETLAIFLLKKGISPLGVFTSLLNLLKTNPELGLLAITKFEEYLALSETPLNAFTMKSSYGEVSCLSHLCSEIMLKRTEWNELTQSLVTILLDLGTDPKISPDWLLDRLPPDLQLLLKNPPQKGSDLSKVGKTLASKILDELPASLTNNLDQTNKTEFLEQLISTIVMKSPLTKAFSNEKDPDVIMLRKSFINTVAEKLKNTLSRLRNFDAEKNVFNQDAIETSIRTAVIEWEAAYKQKATREQTQKHLLENQIATQKELLQEQKAHRKELEAHNDNVLAEQGKLRKEVQAQKEALNKQVEQSKQQAEQLRQGMGHLSNQLWLASQK